MPLDIDFVMGEARKYAKTGSVPIVVASIAAIQNNPDYPTRANELDPQLDAIKRECYKNAIPLYLSMAREDASSADRSGLIYVEHAVACAQFLGMDISSEAMALRALFNRH